VSKHTLVLGASLKPQRYSNLAVRRLAAHGHPVLAVGRREGSIDGVPVITSFPEGADIHTLTLYMNPDNQQAWHAAILGLKPKRVIFNPGTEDDRFARALQQQGVEVVEGCTLVMLSVGTY
jgi:predicted CoA-binding protein